MQNSGNLQTCFFFLVLEILISLAIGALLTGAVGQVLWQLNKSVSKVIGVSSTDIRIAIVQNLFEKEFVRLIGGFGVKINHICMMMIMTNIRFIRGIRNEGRNS